MASLVQRIWQMYKRFLRWHNGPMSSSQEDVTSNTLLRQSDEWFQMERCCGRGHEMMRNPYMPDISHQEFWICPQCNFQIHLFKYPQGPKYLEME